MIQIKVFQNEKGLILGFSLKGHAGYKQSGKDIICSAISMLAINTLNSLEKFTEDTFTYQEDEALGYMEFHMVSNSHDSQLLLQSFLLGLETVKKEYGKKYIDLNVIKTTKEV